MMLFVGQMLNSPQISSLTAKRVAELGVRYAFREVNRYRRLAGSLLAASQMEQPPSQCEWHVRAVPASSLWIQRCAAS